MAVLGGGIAIRLTSMPKGFTKGLTTGADVLGVYKYPELERPLQFVADHYRPGDVVIAIQPEVNDHNAAFHTSGSFQASFLTDFGLESTLQLPVVLDDRRSVPLHRWCGTVTLTNIEDLEDIFARHERVWYITIPGFHTQLNDISVTVFLREHMDVVYEDFESVVLFRGNNHRTAEQRLKDDGTLQKAKAEYLQ
jgi:hypothetical protein